MRQYLRNNLAKTARILKRMAIILLTASATVGLVGGITYGLYRIALFDKDVYAAVFFAAFGALVAFFIYRAVRKGYMKRVLIKTIRALTLVLLVCAIIAAFFLLGGLILRRPLIGIAAAPILFFSVMYLLPRFKVTAFFERYLP